METLLFKVKTEIDVYIKMKFTFKYYSKKGKILIAKQFMLFSPKETDKQQGKQVFLMKKNYII